MLTCGAVPWQQEKGQNESKLVTNDRFSAQSSDARGTIWWVRGQENLIAPLPGKHCAALEEALLFNVGGLGWGGWVGARSCRSGKSALGYDLVFYQWAVGYELSSLRTSGAEINSRPRPRAPSSGVFVLSKVWWTKY